MNQWQRNNLAATFALFLLTLGFSFTVPFLPLYLQDLDGLTGERAAFWAGVATGLGGLGALLTGPFWGTLGDRFGRKYMLVRAAFGGAFGLLMIGASNATWQVVLWRLWVGIMAGAGPAALALIAGGTPDDRLSRAMGTFQAVSLLGLALGPVAAFPLIEALGYRATFFATSGVMGIGAVVTIVMIREDRTSLRAARAQARSGPSGPSAFRVILRSSTARRSFAIVTLLGLGVPMAQSSVLASFVRTIVPANDVTSNVGRLFSGIAIFGALAALLAARLLERHGTTRVLTISCLGAGALLIPQGFADEMWQLAPFVVAVAFFQGGVQTATVRLISNTISRSDAGVGFGIYQSIQVGAAQIGPFLGGALADFAGFRAVFPVAGVVLIVSGTLASFALPKTVAPAITSGDETPVQSDT